MSDGTAVALELSVKLGTHGLPLRSAVLARRQRRLRILAAGAALCLFGFVAAVAYEMWPRRAEVVADVAKVFAPPVAADAVLAAMPAPERPAYRHSIVQGGVYSPNEVADAVRKDDVVAAHYEDIDLAALHPKTVPAARAVYVSYRIGDRVFWTKNRVRLAAGETVLTDGNTEIRARCGNLVSDHAQQPVAEHEPPLTALDETQPETGSSTIAGVRDPEGGVNDVPELPALASGLAFGALPPAGVPGMPGMPGGQDTPMWAGGAGGGIPLDRSRTGIVGSPFAPPLGNSERTDRGHEGDGKGNDDSHSPTGGGSNHDGSNGDGSNEGGSHGGGHDDPHHPSDPPTTTNDLVGTTTGGPEGTTGGDDSGTTGSSESSGDVSAVPEPAVTTLLVLGAIGAAVRTMRSRR